MDKAAKAPASEFKPLPNHEFKKGDSILLLRADEHGELIDEDKARTCPHTVLTDSKDCQASFRKLFALCLMTLQPGS